MGGLRPVAELMTVNFALLAMDQLVNHMAKIRSMFGGQTHLPMVVRMPGGGGSQLAAQHSQSLESYFMHCPGFRVAYPATPADAKGLLKTAIRDNNPVLFLEHKLLYPLRFEVPDELPPPLPFGFAKVVREGTDVTLVTWSYMTHLAQQAAARLAQEGIEAEIVDLLTLSPLDIDTVVESAKNTGRVILVEEGPKTGGFAAEIAAQIMERAHDYLEKPVRRLASPDFPVPSAKNLEAACIPTVPEIAALARELVEG
jgi:pyruvate dehydrogenase E1 component beta subunit